MNSRKIIAASFIALSTLTLTSCTAAGKDAPTSKIKQVTDGAEAKITTDGNDLRIVNTLLVATEDGSAVVVGTIVNASETADTLLGIYAGGTQAKITGETTLNKNQPIIFEGDSATTKGVFAGVGAEPGKHVTVTFAFARAGKVSLDVIIRDKRDDYAKVTA